MIAEVQVPIGELRSGKGLKKVFSELMKRWHIEGLLEAWELAADGVRLALVEADRRLCLDGVRVDCPAAEWTTVKCVALCRGGAISSAELESKAFPHRDSGAA